MPVDMTPDQGTKRHCFNSEDVGEPREEGIGSPTSLIFNDNSV